MEDLAWVTWIFDEPALQEPGVKSYRTAFVSWWLALFNILRSLARYSPSIGQY